MLGQPAVDRPTHVMWTVKNSAKAWLSLLGPSRTSGLISYKLQPSLLPPPRGRMQLLNSYSFKDEVKYSAH